MAWVSSGIWAVIMHNGIYDEGGDGDADGDGDGDGDNFLNYLPLVSFLPGSVLLCGW